MAEMIVGILMAVVFSIVAIMVSIGGTISTFMAFLLVVLGVLVITGLCMTERGIEKINHAA